MPHRQLTHCKHWSPRQGLQEHSCHTNQGWLPLDAQTIKGAPTRQRTLPPPLYHCTARVPSTDAASSRAGVVGNSVQNRSRRPPSSSCNCLRKLASPALTFCAAHLPWPARAPLCCDGMIAPSTLECSPDALTMACLRNFPRLRACICASGSPPKHTHIGHRGLFVRTATKSTQPQKWCYGALCSLCQLVHCWSVETQPASIAASTAVSRSRLPADSNQPIQQGIKCGCPPADTDLTTSGGYHQRDNRDAIMMTPDAT